MKTNQPENRNAFRAMLACGALVVAGSIINVANAANAANAAGDPIASWDFQGMTVDVAPGSNNWATGQNDIFTKYEDRVDGSNGASNLIRIVGAASTSAADPFGGADNKSVYIRWKAQTSEGVSNKHPALQLALPGYNTTNSFLAAGTLTFDVWVKKPSAGTGIIEFDLNATGTNGDSVRANSIAAFQVWGNSSADTGTVYVFDGSASGGSVRATNASFAYGSKNTFSVSWDAATDSFSISLNGEAVTCGTGASLVSSFAQCSDQAGVSSIRFTSTAISGGENTMVEFWVDNVIVTTAAAIPELASSALAFGSLAALALFAVAGRRRRC